MLFLDCFFFEKFDLILKIACAALVISSQGKDPTSELQEARKFLTQYAYSNLGYVEILDAQWAIKERESPIAKKPEIAHSKTGLLSFERTKLGECSVRTELGQ